MFNLDDITNKNNEDQNNKWPCILNRSCRILTIGGYGSGKSNALINLIKEQDSVIDKIYLYGITKISTFN